MQAFKILSVISLSVCAWAGSKAPLRAGELMPWETEVTVKAKVFMRVNKRENWPYLKFSKPLDFKAVPGDPDTFDIKNVRYVALVGGVEFDELADHRNL